MIWFKLQNVFKNGYVMITSVLYDLYISDAEENKTEFSPHLYASEKNKKTFP